MLLLISIDEHYISDGTMVYSTQGTTPYSFWSEYLEFFDEVLVLARLRHEVSFVGRPAAIANGPRVRFLGLVDFNGPLQYAIVRRLVVSGVREAIAKADAYLLRVPGIIGGLAAAELERAGKPYAAQVGGDPWEVFGSARVGGPLRLLYKYSMTHELRRICERAKAVAYVTQSTLQRRYPTSRDAFVAAWSDVRIGNAIVSDREIQSRILSFGEFGSRRIALGFAGSLEQGYKGADVLLKAVAICRDKGLNLSVRLAGDGRLLSNYRRLATRLRIEDRVEFMGRIGAGKPMFDFLDAVDLFVMPSLTEGLPRALIEAMARGCPCIASDVGGIPELLEKTDLVRAGDPVALANKIIQSVARPDELARMIRRNHSVARGYAPEHARPARLAFLKAVRESAKQLRSQEENGR